MKEPIQNDNKKQFLENFLKGQKTTEVYEDLSFNEILEKLNDLDFSDGRTYVVCDKNNPQNYMEISASSEIHNERQYINTEFRLFSQGVQQKCDVFPHGRFTHYTRADGNNSTDKGEEYWDKMKAEMGNTYNVGITVNAAPGQSAKQIAQEVARELQRSVNQKGAVWA